MFSFSLPLPIYSVLSSIAPKISCFNNRPRYNVLADPLFPSSNNTSYLSSGATVNLI